MIESVIKRAGQTEPFSVEKINKWWIWAGNEHGIQAGEGSEAVQRALQALPKICTTEQIQRALINELVALKRWNTIMMAGTLEASLVQKKIFPKGLPTVEDHFKKMAHKGFMINFDFTDREWLEIEDIIDHKRDFHMPQFSVKYLMESYAIGNVTTGSRLETPQFVYMRMAAAVASTYPVNERIEILKEQYDLLSSHVLSAPTPNFTHLGTPDNGLASCCLYTAKDDRKSLAAAGLITYVMTYSSAGLGYHQAVRSVGDPVRGGMIQHQGEMWYLRHNAAGAAANRQSKRGGAINAYISAYSKEAKNILAAREPTAPVGSALTGIDVSLSITRDFISRAVNRDAGLSFSEWSNPDLYKAMYSGDPKHFETLMKAAIEKNKDQMFQKR
jgi:ribonucleoside-diphosphate reductase alpha chain